MGKKIAVIGSSNTDMIVQLPALPSPGETLLGGEFGVAAGGKGANQAVAAARLGADVVFIARIGKDIFGDQALDNLKKDGIETGFIVRDEQHSSGVALIMVDQQGENMIAVAPGSNAYLVSEDIERARDAISECSVMLLQLEVPLRTVHFAAQLGNSLGMTVILNPAPATTLDKELLDCVSILTPNETETEILTGVLPTDRSSTERSVGLLREKGVDEIVITLGEAGAFVAGNDPGKVIPGIEVSAVDTTAAGDAFNGALATSLAEGLALEQSVRFANRVAGLSVTRLGAQPSLPTREEVELSESNLDRPR
jgi:ribokinase